MSQKETITRAALMKFIRVSNNRTITKYINIGLLPRPILEGEEMLFKRSAVLDILGLKEMPEEPFMTASEVADYLKYPKNSIANYIKNKNIPYYVIHNVRGAHILCLKSEIDAAIALRVQWDIEFPNVLVKQYIKEQMMTKVLPSVLRKYLNSEEQKIVTDALVKNKSIKKLAKEFKMTPGGIKQRINRICFKIYSKLSFLIGEVENIESLRKANTDLQQQNLELQARINALTEKKSSFGIVIPEDKSMFLHMYDLSARSSNFLKREEIVTVAQLAEFTLSHIKKFMNIGQVTIDELSWVLEQNNLTWKPELNQEENEHRKTRRKRRRTKQSYLPSKLPKKP